MLKSILNLLLTHLNLSKGFVDILEPVLEKAGDTFLGDSTVAAEPIVKELESGTLPSSQKLEAAVTQLTDTLKSQGKSIAPSVAHLAVELALQKVKSIL